MLICLNYLFKTNYNKSYNKQGEILRGPITCNEAAYAKSGPAYTNNITFGPDTN